MAKIQVIMALTLDGFLPHENETLMRWVRENRRYGFPHWSQDATFRIYPHYGLMDLLDVREKHDKGCAYLAEVQDGGSAEYAGGLFPGIIWWTRRCFTCCLFLMVTESS